MQVREHRQVGSTFAAYCDEQYGNRKFFISTKTLQLIGVPSPPCSCLGFFHHSFLIAWPMHISFRRVSLKLVLLQISCWLVGLDLSRFRPCLLSLSTSCLANPGTGFVGNSPLFSLL